MRAHTWVIRVGQIAIAAVGIAGCGVSSDGAAESGNTSVIGETYEIGGCSSVEANSGFHTLNIGYQGDPFSLEFDASPATTDEDALFGIGRGPLSTYTDLAAVLRFNTSGQLDARDGGSYRRSYQAAYKAGLRRQYRFDVNPASHTYSVSRLTPAGIQTIGSNFAFRSEEASTSTLDQAAIVVDSGGPLNVCNVFLGAHCVIPSVQSGFSNRALATQSVAFTASVSATPQADGVDAVIGLSSGPAGAFNDIAAAVRFNPSGQIDARNGSEYAASTPMSYAVGTTYDVLFVVDVLGHSYSVWVNGNLLAHHFAFRTQQATVTSLDHFVAVADAGPGSVQACDYTFADGERVAWMHDFDHWPGEGPGGWMAGLSTGEVLAGLQDHTLIIDQYGEVTGSVPYGGAALQVDAADNRYLAGRFQGTYDGGGGHTVTSAGDMDIYVSKYDTSWNNVFTRRFGGSGEDWFESFAANGTGEMLLQLPTSLLRLDAQGNELWTQERTVPQRLVALDDDGSTFFAQDTANHGSFTITKLDRAGNEAWTHQATVLDGGATLYGLLPGADGRVVAWGSLYGRIDFGGPTSTAAYRPDGDETFVAEVDATGAYYGATVVDIVGGVGAGIDASGRITVGGYSWNPDNYRLQQIKFDGTGGGLLTGDDLTPGLWLGSGGSPQVDRAGNVYWWINARMSPNAVASYYMKVRR